MRQLPKLLFLAIACFGYAGVEAADAPTNGPATGPSAPPAAVVAPALPATSQPAAPATPLEAIRQSATPSEAVAAYARAANTPGADPVLIGHVYVQRMIDFGMPELAEAQARDLINHNSSDGPSLGVVAYMAATRGEYGAAIQQLKMGLGVAPQDPFLLRTAGQLVAWYDQQTDRSMLTQTDTQALEAVRTQSTGKQAFADAYRDATQQRPAQPPASRPIETS